MLRPVPFVLHPRRRSDAVARAARVAKRLDPRRAFALTPALVVGIGNTTRRDDGAGVLVAEAVAIRIPDADVVAVHQLVPELAERMADADVAVFVDASERVDEVTVTEVVPDATSFQTHVSSPGALLALAGALRLHRPDRVLLIEIPARELGFGESLSEVTRAAIPRAVEQVLEAILT